MSRTSVHRLSRMFLVVLCLGAMAGCKKKVPTPPPVEQPRPVELSVLSANPNQGRADQATPVSISGTGFQQGARVTLGDTVAQEVSVSSPTTLRAVVPSGLKAGVYNISVRNPDGKEGQLQRGFTVIEPTAPPRSTDCTLQAVYFDFDASSLGSDARDILQRDVECVRSRNAQRIEVLGHTDERGSTDYNLALGQRRADEVKRYLIQLGFNNVTAISYGEERPANMGSGEDAWGQNRRAEIQIGE